MIAEVSRFRRRAWSIIGRRYAAVLPLPVELRRIMSLPSRAFGIASDWGCVGEDQWLSRILRKIRGSRPKDAKVGELVEDSEASGTSCSLSLTNCKLSN